MPERILLTGAAGKIGTMLRSRLARPDRVLRLLDLAPQEPAAAGERVELVTASITDLPAMCTASKDVDAVIHMGGISGEDSWSKILDVNINGTHAVLDAARRAGVGRVILASSNHAVGFAPLDGGTVPDGLLPRPDTYYGVSKAAMEALGSLYHDRYGLDVIAIRIGACRERPTDSRELSIWLSPDDCARLLEAAISVPRPGFRLIWGVSANTRGFVSLAEAEAIGYQPQDDAEAFAGDVKPAGELARKFVGGRFCSPANDDVEAST
ncbi:MAG TPA: NAD(P)-dependent oxidoreductase [Actinophytocola sp.]|uniref:NAD-dependent epimerase/dehydratase family protein n=1 Tax=Actinophytocola sp. TaxID=1872138 RepID=UPI002DBAC9A3|nr:NAD(P)-dependent oxidoreductase [Actinophytocola sp.]HEU5472323.1 NAD(P)-dependent oxidoreductase [Actinophytocola sp.]